MTTTKKFNYYAFALLGSTLMLFSSCEKEDEKNVPVLTTAEVTDITQTTATSGGNITDDGGATIKARGVCWSASQNSTINDSKTEDGTGTGSFTSSIAGLEPNKIYYVRAYATNSSGTGYGSAILFKTLEAIKLPTLTTSVVTEITQTTATSGGNITDDGGATVTARGVCWSTSQNPTINESKTEVGTSAGSFTSSIYGLEPSTTYYIRAYATNSEGTGYGVEKSFSTYNSDAITDIDGNYYNIVTIGNQKWMAENLRTTKYSDGTNIPNVTENSEWASLSTPAYCWYNNDQTTYRNTYGALYNWYAVNTGNLCPSGWRVPTDDEWKNMEGTIDSNYGIDDPMWNNTGWRGYDVGTKLKSTTGWNFGGNGSDDFGFSAIPGGGRKYFYSNFYFVGDYGYWWSSSEYNATSTWARGIHYDGCGVGRFYINKEYGYSVRCLRDN